MRTKLKKGKKKYEEKREKEMQRAKQLFESKVNSKVRNSLGCQKTAPERKRAVNEISQTC